IPDQYRGGRLPPSTMGTLAKELAPPFRNPFVHDLRFTPLEKAKVSDNILQLGATCLGFFKSIKRQARFI
uniref:Uncharacterized protein n=1 Tax=Hucho hucho TaxID=62062 RepID=A0A4W5NL92_9TELE